jgi:RNA polymerase sigma-70 factor (ECF subfamily)
MEQLRGAALQQWLARAYDAWGARLYRHALMILADRSLAEDAVQQTFARLLGRGMLHRPESDEAFLRVVLRNEAYRLLSSIRRYESLEAVPLLEASGTEPVDVDEQRRLEVALRSLPPAQREVLHLRIWEGLTFAQIARLLQIPPNTAASRYRYALDALRQMLVKEKQP